MDLVGAIADTVLRTMLHFTPDGTPWTWGLILFAVNLVMLFIAFGFLGRGARRNVDDRRMITRPVEDKVAATVSAQTN